MSWSRRSLSACWSRAECAGIGIVAGAWFAGLGFPVLDGSTCTKFSWAAGRETSVARSGDPPSEDNESTGSVMGGRLPGGRYGLSCTGSSSGRIVCFGGVDRDDHALDEIVEYDPVADTTNKLNGRLPVPSFDLGCVTYSSDTVFCFGGRDDDNDEIHTIVRYDRSEDRTATMKSRLIGSFGRTCGRRAKDGLIYCIDESAPTHPRVLAVRTFDPEEDTIQFLVKPEDYQNATDPALASCASTADRVFCFGASSPTAFYFWFPAYEFRRHIGENPGVPVPLAYPSCTAAANGRIYCFGGRSRERFLDAVFEYDSVGRTFRVSGSRLPSPRAGLSCAQAADRGIYCLGGFGYPDRHLDEIVRFEIGDLEK